MSPDPEPRTAWIARVLGLVLLAGAALRVAAYLYNPSLSVDEAMLALGVASRSFAGLLRPPLPYDQIAPPLFLWVSRTAALVGGVREPVLRLLPLLSGIALPYVVWRAASRFVAPGWALFAAACTALSPILVSYGVTFKPYATDALVSVALLWLTLDVLAAPERPAPWKRLAVGGLLAIASSLPAVFGVAGSGLALASSTQLRRERRGWKRLIGVVVLWAGAFGGLYVAVLRNPAASDYMQAFWMGRFLTPDALAHPARAAGLLRWFTSQAFTAARPLDWVPPLTWLAALGGAYQVLRHRGAAGVAVVGPILAMLGASVVHRYPIAPRVCLFAAPLLFLLFAAFGAALWQRWSGRRARALVTGVAALGMVTLMGSDRKVLQQAPPPTRTLVMTLGRMRRSGDPVYILASAVPAWTVYTTDWHAPDTTRLNGILRTQSVAGTAFHNAAGRGHAVADTEGAHLVFRDAAGAEIIGLAPGMQWREGAGFTQARPDPGWAARDGARIREAAGAESGVAWLALADAYPNQAQELQHALAALGGRAEVVWSATDGGAQLVRVRFSEGRGS